MSLTWGAAAADETELSSRRTSSSDTILLADVLVGSIGSREVQSCLAGRPGQDSGAQSESSTPIMLPIPHPNHSFRPRASKLDGDLVNSCGWNDASVEATPWMAAAPLSLLSLPVHSPLDTNLSIFVDDIGTGSSDIHRPLGAAGFFSAWLKGERPEATVSPAEPTALWGHSGPDQQQQQQDDGLARLPGRLVRNGESLLEPSKCDGPVAVPACGSDPPSGAAALGSDSSLPSPAGSDCRAAASAAAADECSSDESGLSHSRSWDAQSSCSSIGVSSNGSDMGPEPLETLQWCCDDSPRCPTPEAQVSPRGVCSPLVRIAGADEPVADVEVEAVDILEYPPLRVVECDGWEHEVEVQMELEAAAAAAAAVKFLRRGSADVRSLQVAVAPHDVELLPPLSHMVWLVVTQALFDPPYGEACV